MKKLLSFAAGLALVAGTSTAAQAQCNSNGCTLPHTVSATAPTILLLTLSTASTTITPVEADFDVAGGRDDAGPVLTLKSNKTASVTIQADAATWSGPGSTTKAAADLRWRTATLGGTAPGTSITTSPVTVFAAGKGNRTATVTWNTLWNLTTDEPGAYSLATTFTVVVP